MRLCDVANPNSIQVQHWVSYSAGQRHEIHLINARPGPAPELPGVELHWMTAISVPKLRNFSFASIGPEHDLPRDLYRCVL